MVIRLLSGDKTDITEQGNEGRSLFTFIFQSHGYNSTEYARRCARRKRA
jgi:hypothetical protein